MGLDMALYRVSKPENVSDGDRISERDRSEKYEDVQFLEPEDGICKTVMRYAVKCFCEKTSFDHTSAVTDMFVKLGADEAQAAVFAGCFRKTVSKSGSGFAETIFRTEDRKAKKFLKKSGVGKRGNTLSVCIEKTESVTVECLAADNDSVTVRYSWLEEEGYYNGRYNESEWAEHYAFVLTDAAYQRGGLNDEGFEMLPENGSLCDDKELVRRLVEKGGLSPEFIEKWEDGVTVFFNWW